MTRFDTFLRAVLDRAADEAREDGSATVEAHHLLLAIAVSRESTTGQVLASAALDHRAIREALDREFEQSLSVAGVSRAAFALPPPSHDERPPQLGTSVRLAVERGLGSTVHKRGPRPAHLLLGILRAEVGTVPRALALAGVDRAGLADRAEQALTDEGE